MGALRYSPGFQADTVVPLAIRQNDTKVYDASVLQAAAQAAFDGGGDALNLPAGTIVVEEPITFSRNAFDGNRCAIRGAGRRSTELRAGATFPPGRGLIECEGGFVDIENVSFLNPAGIADVYGLRLIGEDQISDTETRGVSIETVFFSQLAEGIRNENQGRVTIRDAFFLLNGTAINFENGGHIANLSDIYVQSGMGIRFSQTGDSGVSGWSSEGRTLNNIQMVLVNNGIVFEETTSMTACQMSNICIDVSDGVAIDIRGQTTGGGVKNTISLTGFWLGAVLAGGNQTTGIRARGAVNDLKVAHGRIRGQTFAGVDLDGTRDAVTRGISEFSMVGVTLDNDATGAVDFICDKVRGELRSVNFVGDSAINEVSDDNILDVSGGSMIPARVVRQSANSTYRGVRNRIGWAFIDDIEPIADVSVNDVTAAGTISARSVSPGDVVNLTNGTATTYDPARNFGEIFITTNNQAFGRFSFGNGTVTERWTEGPARFATVNNTVLDGTNGTASRITISQSGGIIYIANQVGSLQNIAFQVIS